MDQRPNNSNNNGQAPGHIAPGAVPSGYVLKTSDQIAQNARPFMFPPPNGFENTVPLDIQFNPNVSFFVDSEMMRQSSGVSVAEPDSVMGESGRLYHGYMEGKYLLPNDPAEQDRLDFQHAMITLLLDGKLSLAPLNVAPRMVLDVATGTGVWALEFARSNPASMVLGTDLSAIQPNPDVPNCFFEKSDCEEDWLYSFKFEYIHIRMIVACIHDPLKLIREAYKNLELGGRLEIQDMLGEFTSDDGTHLGSAMYRWQELGAAGLAVRGYDTKKADKYKQWMVQAGFVDVREHVFRIPCSPWPSRSDPKGRRVGQYMQKNCVDGLRGISYAALRHAGLTADEIENLVADAKKDLMGEKVHGYHPFYVVYGRKPLDGQV